MTQTINWGMMGLGSIAHEFAEAFAVEEACLYGAASRSLTKAQDFAKQYHIEHAYGSYEDMLADPAIDIVYLATPNKFHYEHLLAILNAGKHVLCEKAITMNKKELEEVLAVAEAQDLMVAEAMTIYHMPLFKKIKKEIDQGTFGPLKMVNAYFGSLKEADPKNRFFNPELGGGALLDIGVYALSFVDYFLDAPIEEMTTLNHFYSTSVDEMSTIALKTANHTLGNISLAFRSKLPKQGVIACEDAYITVMNYPRADQAIVTYPDGQTDKITAGQTRDALNYEAQALTATLLGHKKATYIENTQRVNDIMDSAAREWEMDWIFK